MYVSVSIAISSDEGAEMIKIETRINPSHTIDHPTIWIVNIYEINGIIIDSPNQDQGNHFPKELNTTHCYHINAISFEQKTKKTKKWLEMLIGFRRSPNQTHTPPKKPIQNPINLGFHVKLPWMLLVKKIERIPKQILHSNGFIDIAMNFKGIL